MKPPAVIDQGSSDVSQRNMAATERLLVGATTACSGQPTPSSRCPLNSPVGIRLVIHVCELSIAVG